MTRRNPADPGRTAIVISCEHGGYRVPPRYAARFRGALRVLQSHRGYDPGALELARRFARELSAPAEFATVTRLLVELNRSLGHPQLFSEYTRELDGDAKQQLIADYYQPYRAAVGQRIEHALARAERVCHLSVHSFTPVLRGERRRADVGLLYDPRRRREQDECRAWQRALRLAQATLQVGSNYPYQGRADGLTTHLRRQFDAARYLGIELEVNQRWVRRGGAAWSVLQDRLIETFARSSDA